MTDLAYLVDLLGISETDVIRAILACYTPTQPGVISAAWKNRKNYGKQLTAKQIQKLYEDADYRCSKCKGTYKIAIDHIDDNSNNSSLENFQVLCKSCNRSKQKRGVKTADRAYVLFKELRKLGLSEGLTAYQVCKSAGIAIGGDAEFKLRYLMLREKQRNHSRA